MVVTEWLPSVVRNMYLMAVLGAVTVVRVAQSFSRLTKAYVPLWISVIIVNSRLRMAKKGWPRECTVEVLKTSSLVSRLVRQFVMLRQARLLLIWLRMAKSLSLLTVVVVDVEISALRHLVTLLPKSLKMVNQVKSVNFNWNWRFWLMLVWLVSHLLVNQQSSVW